MNTINFEIVCYFDIAVCCCSSLAVVSDIALVLMSSECSLQWGKVKVEGGISTKLWSTAQYMCTTAHSKSSDIVFLCLDSENLLRNLFGILHQPLLVSTMHSDQWHRDDFILIFIIWKLGIDVHLIPFIFPIGKLNNLNSPSDLQTFPLWSDRGTRYWQWGEGDIPVTHMI